MRITGHLTITAIALLSLTASADAGQQAASSDRPEGLTREIAFYAGVLLAPDEVGRDVNRAGGDVLIARLGDSAVWAGRFETHNGWVGGAFDLSVCAKRVGVRNEAGIEFPNHGKSPAVYAWEGRLYPFGESMGGGRLVPYTAGGFGGALLSVDLDNVNDQELRHLWVRTVSAGVKFIFNGAETFLDIQFKASFLSGRGPIQPFDTRAIVVGLGGRY